MKNIPQRIFLNIQEDDMKEFNDFSVMNRRSVITWSECQIYDDDIEYVRKKSPWISVKDRLPQPGEEVLLYDNHSIKQYLVGWLREKKGYNSSMWALTNGYVKDNDITHWMPIPEFNK